MDSATLRLVFVSEVVFDEAVPILVVFDTRDFSHSTFYAMSKTFQHFRESAFVVKAHDVELFIASGIGDWLPVGEETIWSGHDGFKITKPRTTPEP